MSTPIGVSYSIGDIFLKSRRFKTVQIKTLMKKMTEELFDKQPESFLVSIHAQSIYFRHHCFLKINYKVTFQNIKQQYLVLNIKYMISAQIKRGNTYLIDSLEDYMLQMITLPANRSYKPLKLNYYNFIEVIIELTNQFIRSKGNITFNLFIIDYYVKKYEKTGDLYRYFFGLTQVWKRCVQGHEDAKLFLSLLSDERNDKESVRVFVKIRKIILKTINAKILEEIPVTHSDALTICHMLFTGENRSKVIKKINTLFISLKRKLVNTAKVNGAVACQFFMSASEELDDENYPLQLTNQLKGKITQAENHRISEKQNELSFSQQYAGYYAKKNMNLNLHEEQDDEIEWQNNGIKAREQAIFEEEAQNIEQEWGKEKKMLDLDNARQSLSKLSRKDRDIDAKLHGSGLIQWKNYPEGWDQFIRKNQIQKQKLLHGVKN